MLQGFAPLSYVSNCDRQPEKLPWTPLVEENIAKHCEEQYLGSLSSSRAPDDIFC